MLRTNRRKNYTPFRIVDNGLWKMYDKKNRWSMRKSKEMKLSYIKIKKNHSFIYIHFYFLNAILTAGIKLLLTSKLNNAYFSEPQL